MNWPIGSGDRFRGVIDRRTQQVILFLRAERGRTSEEKVLSVEEARSSGAVEPELLDAWLDARNRAELRRVAAIADR